MLKEFLVDTEGKLTALCLIGSPSPLLFSLFEGGTELQDDVHQFNKNGAHIVIATPGRLNHIMQALPAFNVRQLEILVFDEADRLLDMGFNEVIQSILVRFPKQRRTVCSQIPNQVTV